jgi:predicted metalloprotease
MSTPREEFKSRLVQAIGLVASVVGVLVFATATLPAPVRAQQTPTPEVDGYRDKEDGSTFRGDYSQLYNEIDQFWFQTFQDARLEYYSPEVVNVTTAMQTPCGAVHPEEENAYYCPDNATIYLLPDWMDEQSLNIGDYAPITIVAHEWGHHIQNLVNADHRDNKAFELQADCLSGVFTAHADASGLLDPGDFLEALSLAIDSGDTSLGLPIDNPDAHGTSEERIKALTRGFGGGPFTGCNAPIEVEADDSEDRDIPLPDVLPLNHAACFGIVDDGTLNFEQLLGRFSGVPDAATRLQSWEWQTSAFRQFGCDGPPEGEAGWIDISAHRFGDSLAAQEAVDYFAAVRAEGGPLFPVAPPEIGDHAAALSGPAVNGKEFTIYASQGPLLVRVTGVSPSGIPFINVLTVTLSVFAAQQGQPQVVPTPPVQPPSLPASSYLPAVPAVRHRDCFGVLTEGMYVYGDVVDALEPTGLSQSQIDELGWKDGAYIVFTCDEPPVGRAAQLDVVIHQFQDAQSAQQALPFARGMYAPGEKEEWSCDTAAQLVNCVVGRSITGSPLSDVHFVLNQVVDGAR